MNLINYNFMTKIADHCLDFPESFYKSIGVSKIHNKNFIIENIKSNDVIFVKTDFVYKGEFQRNYLPKLTKDVILITGVSSFSVDEGYDIKPILNNNHIKKWYCTNCPPNKSQKMAWLPIGFEEQEREGGNKVVLHHFYKKDFSWDEKKNKIYIPYHGDTYGTRRETIEKLRQLDFVEIESGKLRFHEYLKKMSQYKFILSLRGSGWDCHRHYESLLVNSVPILDGGPIIDIFRKHKVPVLNIESINPFMFDMDFDFSNTKKFLTEEYYFNKIKENK